jgi:hypothetical protein
MTGVREKAMDGNIHLQKLRLTVAKSGQFYLQHVNKAC